VYPHLPLFAQQGLGIALLSYAGRLHVGITADWDLEALLADLVARLDAAFDELVELAELPPEDATRGNGRAKETVVPLQLGAARV
jgi:hypothetical protein